MTHMDIFVTIVSEVSGKPIEEVRKSFPAALKTPKMMQELPDNEAMSLLEDLRKEKAGIVNWALEGIAKR